MESLFPKVLIGLKVEDSGDATEALQFFDISRTVRIRPHIEFWKDLVKKDHAIPLKRIGRSLQRRGRWWGSQKRKAERLFCPHRKS